MKDKKYADRTQARALRHQGYAAQAHGSRLSRRHPETQSLGRPPRGLQEGMDWAALEMLPPAERIRRYAALDVARAYGLDPEEV